MPLSVGAISAAELPGDSITITYTMPLSAGAVSAAELPGDAITITYTMPLSAGAVSAAELPGDAICDWPGLPGLSPRIPEAGQVALWQGPGARRTVHRGHHQVPPGGRPLPTAAAAVGDRCPQPPLQSAMGGRLPLQPPWWEAAVHCSRCSAVSGRAGHSVQADSDHSFQIRLLSTA